MYLHKKKTNMRLLWQRSLGLVMKVIPGGDIPN
jgi:hypothetical protein